MVFVVFFVADIMHSTFLIPNGLKVNLYSIRFSSDLSVFYVFASV